MAIKATEISDLIKQRIEAFGDKALDDSAAAPPSAEAGIPSPAPAAPDQTPAAAVETAQPAVATNDAESATNIPALPDEAIVAAPEVAELAAEVAEAHDEAVLDLVALEMAAPDPSDADHPSAIDHDEIRAASPSADPEMIAQAPEPMAAPAIAPAIQPSPQLSLVQPLPVVAPEPSLGATLIANGIVRKRVASVSDPLAPIRRLSQAEKIALFS